MDLETGVMFSIHGDCYVELKNRELWRDYRILEWGPNQYYINFEQKNNKSMEMKDFITNIWSVVQQNVRDSSPFAQRTLEIEIVREPYVKIKNFIPDDRSEPRDEKYHTYGGSTMLYLTPTKKLIYPANLFEALKIHQSTNVYLKPKESKDFLPQCYGRFPDTYNAKKCDVTELDSGTPLRIIDYYHGNLLVSQITEKDTIIDYNLNQLYPIVPTQEQLSGLLNLLKQQTEALNVNGVYLNNILSK